MCVYFNTLVTLVSLDMTLINNVLKGNGEIANLGGVHVMECKRCRRVMNKPVSLVS